MIPLSAADVVSFRPRCERRFSTATRWSLPASRKNRLRLASMWEQPGVGDTGQAFIDALNARMGAQPVAVYGGTIRPRWTSRPPRAELRTPATRSSPSRRAAPTRRSPSVITSGADIQGPRRHPVQDVLQIRPRLTTSRSSGRDDSLAKCESRQCIPSVAVELDQPLIADSEVVRDLVEHDVSDFAA